MSKVISRRRPESAPAHWPPRMPAAGPDSSSVTGRSAALRALATPPLDIITCRSPAAPSPSRAPARRSRYFPVVGPTNALMVAVVKRSNSRNCGKMSALVVTNAAGSSSRTIAAARRSCSGFRYENRKQTATASTPSSPQLARGSAHFVLGERHQHLARRWNDPLGHDLAVARAARTAAPATGCPARPSSGAVADAGRCGRCPGSRAS